MLRILRKSSRVLLWVVIIGVGGVFVLYLGFRGGFRPEQGNGPVVRVGDFAFEGRDLERVRLNMEARYRDALGKQFDSEQARNFLVESAASALLRSGLLAWQGQQLGLTVSDDELRTFLRGSGFADASGTLDRQAITNYAEREFGSVRRFQERLRLDLLAEKTSQLLRSSQTVSDAEARDAIRYQLEEVKIAAVRFDGRTPPADLALPEGAGAALLDKDPQRVRKAYESRKNEFDRPEQVRVRHILVHFDAGNPDSKKAAEQRIAALREKITAGAAFADVARESSDDTATKEKGGDLGWITHGSVVAPIEAAAFTQPVGEVGPVVESPQGLHLLLVEEKQPARVVPFEEAQDQVAQDLAKSDASVAAARARAEALSQAVAGGKSLVDAAREQGDSIIRPDPLRRRPDGYVQQIGVAPEVLTAAFALRPDAPSDPTVYAAGDDVFVLIQLLEKKSPSEAEIEQNLAAQRERVEAEYRNDFEALWLAQLRQRLGAEHQLVYDTSAFLQ